MWWLRFKWWLYSLFSEPMVNIQWDTHMVRCDLCIFLPWPFVRLFQLSLEELDDLEDWTLERDKQRQKDLGGI